MAARVKEGRRLHSMGYDFGFFCVRCVRRSMERPWLIGSFAALWGFLSSRVKGEPVLLAPDVVHFLREEQRRKLRALFRGAPVIEPPAQPRTTSCAE